jgi:tripeptide aminopeptidase
VNDDWKSVEGVVLINHERLLNLFLELVQIDSETKQERQICDVLKEKLLRLGLDVFEDNSAIQTGHGAGNLIATLKGTNRKKPPLLLTAHMDTVSPGRSVKPVLSDGFVKSDGTTILGSDDKAGIAVILEGLCVITEKQINHGDIQVIFTVGEEAGLVGSKALNPALIRAQYGFAFDSDGQVGDIIVAAPSQAKLDVTVYGRSAHAGVNPEDGISAIQLASQAIAQMPLGRIDHETTANIGRFEGGQATNIVCDQVHILAEARSLKQEKLHQQIETMERIFKEVTHLAGTECDVKVDMMYPSYRFTERDKVVRVAQEAVRRIGRFPRLLESGGGSDANIFSGYGVPTVNLAIGYQNIHTKSEQIPLEELYKAAELVVSIVQVSADNHHQLSRS